MLNKLQAEKLNLQAVLLQLDEDLSTSQRKLSVSFTSGDNSDKLSQEVAQLQAKHAGLLNAIDHNAKSISAEQQRLIDKDKQVDLDQRKSHLKNALKSLDRASQLQGELSKELAIVMEFNSMAVFRNNSEVAVSVRGLVGRLAAQFKLHGALQMSGKLPISTSADYEKLTTHLR